MAKIVNDYVHGPIELEDWAAALLDSPAFQRLRYIRQLSFMHYVFPGAEHSRFSHSLGAMHLARQMVAGNSEVSHEVGDRVGKLVQAAAMLHDIGHLPFSHLTEQAYSVLSLDNSVSGDALPGLGTYCSFTRNELHEHLGAEVIRHQLAEVLSMHQIDVEELAGIVESSTTFPDALLKIMVVHSAVDVDRLDYLQRDAIAVGSKYGALDVDYLVRQFRVGRADWKGQPHNIIGVRKGKEGVIDHLLLSRFFHYSQLVKNHTVVGFEIIARALLAHIIEQGTSLLPTVEQITSGVLPIMKDSDQWMEVTDNLVFTLFQNVTHETDEFWKRLAHNLLHRVRPLKVFEWLELGGYDSPDSINKLKEKLSEIYQWAEAQRLDPAYLAFDIDKISVEPHADQEDRLMKLAMLISKRGEAVPASESKASVLHWLNGLTLHVFRLYWVGTEAGREQELRQVGALQHQIEAWWDKVPEASEAEADPVGARTDRGPQ